MFTSVRRIVQLQACITLAVALAAGWLSGEAYAQPSYPAPRYLSWKPIHLPLFDNPDQATGCTSLIAAQNVGGEPIKAALLTFAEPGACPPGCSGPSAVVCSGVIRPGATWYFDERQLPADARSGALYSFTMRMTQDFDPYLCVGDLPIADLLCDVLRHDVVRDCDNYRRFNKAYGEGLEFYGIGMNRAAGRATLAAQVRPHLPGRGVVRSRATHHVQRFGPLRLGLLGPGLPGLCLLPAHGPRRPGRRGLHRARAELRPGVRGRRAVAEGARGLRAARSCATCSSWRPARRTRWTSTAAWARIGAGAPGCGAGSRWRWWSKPSRRRSLASYTAQAPELALGLGQRPGPGLAMGRRPDAPGAAGVPRPPGMDFRHLGAEPKPIPAGAGQAVGAGSVGQPGGHACWTGCARGAVSVFDLDAVSGLPMASLAACCSESQPWWSAGDPSLHQPQISARGHSVPTGWQRVLSPRPQDRREVHRLPGAAGRLLAAGIRRSARSLVPRPSHGRPHGGGRGSATDPRG